MTAPVLAGAEPFVSGGGPHGALVLHGFTGTPQSMRGLAGALAGAGFAVELPLLPGHGTSIEDMLVTRWDDWSAAAELAYSELQSRCERVVVAGLSLGGLLAAWLASRHPEIAGLAVVNPAVEPAGADVADLLRQTLADGTEVAPAIGNDVADPAAVEVAYDGTPVAPLLSVVEAQEALAPQLGEIRCPALIFTSRQDHVVAPSAGDFLAARVIGPVEQVWLERSFHVATLDYDKDEIESATVAFALRVTAG